jgi:hypothetical protein
MKLGVVRLELHGPAKANHGFVQLALRLKDAAEVIVVGRLGLVQPDRVPDVLGRDIIATHLVGNDPQKMKGSDMIRLDPENPPVDLLGQVQTPGLVVLKGNLKCF